PDAAKLDEAHRLLDLVLSQKPVLKPRVEYWRAVAFTHPRPYERAAEEFRNVLDPSGHGRDHRERHPVLLRSSQLALLLSDELRKRVGLPELAKPGRRMEAIAVVEQHLSEEPTDADAFNLKRELYQDVTEADYAEAAGDRPTLEWFDHAFAQKLG